MLRAKKEFWNFLYLSRLIYLLCKSSGNSNKEEFSFPSFSACFRAMSQRWYWALSSTAAAGFSETRESLSSISLTVHELMYCVFVTVMTSHVPALSAPGALKRCRPDGEAMYTRTRRQRQLKDAPQAKCAASRKKGRAGLF